MKDLSASIAKSLSRLSEKSPETNFTSPGSDKFLSEIPYGVSSQSFTLDLALGRPGYPAGRLTEIAGLESSSKSTLVLHALAQVQKDGGVGVLVETEQGFDSERAALIGIDPDKLIICQPATIEDAFSAMYAVIKDIRGKMRFKGPLLVVWDSVAATPVQAELDGDFGDTLMGAHARVISRAIRKFVEMIARERVTMIFVNQLKTDLRNTYGGEVFQTFGGKAIRFASSVRLEVKKRKRVLDAKKNPIGIEVSTSVVKNKIASPFKKAEYVVGFRGGIDRAADLLNGGVVIGAINENKGWFEYKGVKFQRSSWITKIKTELGGSKKVIQELYDFAIKEKYLKPYGLYSSDFKLTEEEEESML